ncbi:hypothetical protein CHARACLAT_011225, partial [Characodon lateralis]|nr:hypothetical protein [Characodon lateralis]
MRAFTLPAKGGGMRMANWHNLTRFYFCWMSERVRVNLHRSHCTNRKLNKRNWFGDLVTPVWWEDVWLKEGFAHFFEYVGTDFLFPKWNMEKQRFLTDVLHEVMLLDGLSSSHPISQQVEKATDIDRVFDWIAYKKGAALIRMLANVMGQPLFQKGLN